MTSTLYVYIVKWLTARPAGFSGDLDHVDQLFAVVFQSADCQPPVGG